jgi:hypothetical protein
MTSTATRPPARSVKAGSNGSSGSTAGAQGTGLLHRALPFLARL